MRTSNWLTNNVNINQISIISQLRSIILYLPYAVATIRINYRPFATHEPISCPRWASLFFCPRGDLSAITTASLSAGSILRTTQREEEASSRNIFFRYSHASYCATHPDIAQDKWPLLLCDCMFAGTRPDLRLRSTLPARDAVSSPSRA